MQRVPSSKFQPVGAVTRKTRKVVDVVVVRLKQNVDFFLSVGNHRGCLIGTRVTSGNTRV